MSRAEGIAGSKAFESGASLQDPAVEVADASVPSSASHGKAEAVTAFASELPGSSRIKTILLVCTMTTVMIVNVSLALLFGPNCVHDFAVGRVQIRRLSVYHCQQSEGSFNWLKRIYNGLCQRIL
jgi:hypothetical protein